MIRLVARLTLLHRLRLEMDQGRPFEAACQALFVKLPMSARRALAKQAERWTTESIAERLPAVRLASARVRTESPARRRSGDPRAVDASLEEARREALNGERLRFGAKKGAFPDKSYRFRRKRWQNPPERGRLKLRFPSAK